jgi:hypothetical protein
MFTVRNHELGQRCGVDQIRRGIGGLSPGMLLRDEPKKSRTLGYVREVEVSQKACALCH